MEKCRRETHRRDATFPLFDPRPEKHPGQRKQSAGSEMEEKCAGPGLLFQWEAARQPGSRQRKNCEYVPVSERSAEGKSPTHRVADFGPRKVKLAGERQSDDRPQTEKEHPFQPLFSHRKKQMNWRARNCVIVVIRSNVNAAWLGPD